MASNYLNQYWLIVNWTPGNKFQWDLDRNSTISIKNCILNCRLPNWRPFCPRGDDRGKLRPTIYQPISDDGVSHTRLSQIGPRFSSLSDSRLQLILARKSTWFKDNQCSFLCHQTRSLLVQYLNKYFDNWKQTFRSLCQNIAVVAISIFNYRSHFVNTLWHSDATKGWKSGSI